MDGMLDLENSLQGFKSKELRQTTGIQSFPSTGLLSTSKAFSFLAFADGLLHRNSLASPLFHMPHGAYYSLSHVQNGNRLPLSESAN